MMKKLIAILLTVGLLPIVHAQSASDLQAQIDNLSDNLAKDIATRWKFKGDIRYRNEDIRQEFSPDRNRNRIRLRAGATAMVNDDIKAEVQFTTTENGDARSNNQTLTDANSKKALDLDLAYVEYTMNAYTKFTAGKQKYPWYKTASYFFDNDVNPEGLSLALNHANTGLFGSVSFNNLMERSTASDSAMVATQVGHKYKISDDLSYTIAYGMFNHRAIKNYNVQQSSSSGGTFGNTTKNVGCLASATSCYAYDYESKIVSGEINTKLLGYPLVVFADYAKNNKAPVYNTAKSYGFTLGKASLPKSYELGYTYQKTGKDAMFAQWIDSDFGAGVSDSKGHVIRGAYQVAKNFKVNGTYFINKLNNDVSTTVNGAAIKDRDYKRLQLDLNYSF